MCGSYMSQELAEKFNKVADATLRYHVHIYFEPGTASEKTAKTLFQDIQNIFGESIERTGAVGRVGPHTKPNLEIDTTPLSREQLHDLMSFLDLTVNFRGPGENGVSVLLHPRTGNELKDHGELAMWFGQPVGLNQKFLDQSKKDNDKKGPKAA